MNRRVRQILGRASAWLPLSAIGRDGAPALVGVWGVPRGGTNFVAAHLHYHREVFSVSEHELDWRLPLALYWRKRSVLREHGWQDKRVADIRRVVFNKVQRGPLWSADASYPPDSRFVFYFRNPVRCLKSREAAIRKFGDHPFKHEDFDSLLRDFRRMVDTHRTLAARHPCLVLAHEHFCCRFDEARETLRAFLDLAPDGWVEPEAFLARCGRCGGAFAVEIENGERWLGCLACSTRLLGHGHFNPLRPIDLDDIRSEAWKAEPGADERLARIRERVGAEVAEYYERCAFEENLSLTPAAAPCG
jgi:hypothetical protein